MKKALIALIMTLATVLVCPARGESATAVFTVSPAMSCQNCENKIKTNIRFEKGVTDITTDLQHQTVTVTYDPTKTSVEKIAAAFKKIGYTATEAGKAPAAASDGCTACPHSK